ncbi:M13 family metallopeptidase [Rhodococcus sp. IEGM 1401]|uniref:M13 family metallopeptidase n=1 Tax=unclassified Rhodococcus (in: high G+C Gram-positive bacteria) TaxID=192944 RepID=UPI0022B4FED2|nr:MULTISPECIES: M13 family metallopeptidase [unclassified Rhodococcus (in: high G+C Gram-positive bacteria)]MCZ4561764.1 M13 family metallopeptidase [Rhodococcus sp. IEGM 1401]MDI9921853.1 M13 family metallopeptidase [Rhodococcus sp. IEGM 1372]MDV8034358.1 M13 family metallopeptidase [Rhodococcus sp. IEGM 1414]MDV8056224.1 M13 family metallopeptidase [Rhodococcus sp. IEGM 1343]MDV8078748.1 M13 family metallopeptidase [Rhodococcus sp. IEGM 1370]
MTSVVNSGIDLSYQDENTRAQDDLFVHVNGKWLDEYAIPADRAVDGAFRTLYDRAEVDVQTIIEESAAANPPAGSDAQKIGDLFSSFMDADRAEQLGVTPIADELTAISDATDLVTLAGVLGSLQRTGVGGAIGHYVDTDAKQSDRYLVHFSQSGIGLPDESYYRQDEYAEIRSSYIAHISKMFALSGIEYDAQTVFDLEQKIAAGHWDVVARRDAEKSYNLVDFDTLVKSGAGFNWAAWISGLGATTEQFAEIVVRQPPFLTTFVSLWNSEDIEAWKAWLAWRVVHSRAPFLTSAIVDENFAFYGTTLTGTEENRERWKRGVSLVQDVLGEAVGKLYVERHFPADSKARMKVLVDNLTEAYRRNISELEWMSPETRQKALDKLGKFTPKIGYPDRWRDYSGVEISADDLLGNYRRGYTADYQRDLDKLGGPVDRDEWFMTPQTVNAYYNPGMNEIVFPAAILQPPFFDPEADDAANYGGIGAVIGHEIGHGFDDQGAKYDGDGNMVDWWTDSDRTEFGKRTTALIEQYNEFEPKALPGHKVNGEFTIGENIGDLGGLSIAVAAYEISLEGKQAPVLDGLTGLQRVFFGWSQVWRTKARDAEAIRRLAVDPHSPPEFRCNGVVRNLDSFHEAFDVQPGDALYLDPGKRVKIW